MWKEFCREEIYSHSGATGTSLECECTCSGQIAWATSPYSAGSLVYSSQFLQKSRFLWVWFLRVKAEVARVLGRRKLTTSFLFADGHGTGLYFSLGPFCWSSRNRLPERTNFALLFARIPQKAEIQTMYTLLSSSPISPHREFSTFPRGHP